MLGRGDWEQEAARHSVQQHLDYPTRRPLPQAPQRAHQVDVVGLAVPRLHRVPRLQQGAGRTAVHEEMVSQQSLEGETMMWMALAALWNGVHANCPHHHSPSTQGWFTPQCALTLSTLATSSCATGLALFRM